MHILGTIIHLAKARKVLHCRKYKDQNGSLSPEKDPKVDREVMNATFRHNIEMSGASIQKDIG